MNTRIELEEELEVLFEHHAWIGPEYKAGIDDQRIAIVGHSHYRKATEPDDVDFTLNVIREAMENDSVNFQNQISGYFGASNGNFWNRVIFFNFIPECIGSVDCGRDMKYDGGTPSQIEHGRSRTMRILDMYKPHKVFVFAAATWRKFPATREEAANKANHTLIPDCSHSWGTYEFDEHITVAVRLRHPQGATKEEMKLAVKAALAIPYIQ